MRQSFLQKSRPVLAQSVIGIILGLVIVLNNATTDSVLHDFYVKPIIAECYPENQSQFCRDIRDLHGLGTTAHIDIGGIYWQELARQSLMIGVILFGIRMSFSLLSVWFNDARHIRLIDIYVAMLWGLTASLIFIGGFLDVGYYWVQGQPIPDQLPWLSSAGLFEYTKAWFGDPNIVDKMDLYASVVVTIGFIILLWLSASFWWTTEKIKRVI